MMFTIRTNILFFVADWLDVIELLFDLTYALSLPMQHRPQTTCLHPALFCAWCHLKSSFINAHENKQTRVTRKYNFAQSHVAEKRMRTGAVREEIVHLWQYKAWYLPSFRVLHCCLVRVTWSVTFTVRNRSALSRSARLRSFSASMKLLRFDMSQSDVE